MAEKKERCSDCFGSGRNTYNKECICEKCRGLGYVLVQDGDASADSKVEEGNGKDGETAD